METRCDDPFDLFSIQSDFTGGKAQGDTDVGAHAEPLARQVSRQTNEIMVPASASANDDEDDLSTDADAATYEFRWDVEVPAGERRFGQKFMKQWKRVLQVQKMSPLVSPKIAPRCARFQLCVSAREEAPAIAEHEQEVAKELAHLRFQNGANQGIAGEPAGAHPAGWYGVRVWVKFNRQDVEEVLGKKAKI